MKYEFKLNIEDKNSAHVQCLSLIEPNSKVLDVGCAMGILGEYLTCEKKCEVTGVDVIDEFLESARKKGVYKELFKINLDNYNSELDKYTGYFDYILMADVIEHTYNPKEVIEQLKKLLKPDGKLIMSIPNVSHGSIKLSLLANVFRYTEMGLLDKTHIRFFTRETILNLMNESNLQIEDENFVIHSPENVYFEPKNLMKYSSQVLKFVNSDPYSYVYQFVLSAKCSKNPNNENKLICNYKPSKMKKLKKILNFIKR